jgi:DNA-binding LytR/AlgR family response regulator
MKKNKIIFHNEAMVIEENIRIIRVMYKDIVSIVCDAPYLKLFTIDRKELLVYYCLEELANDLPTTFVLCNRSTIINLMHVNFLQCKMPKCFFVLKTGEQIPIAKRKRKEIKEKWKNFDRSPC